ncbi:MAG: alpha/beta hydrolase [Candidatus Hodarchaeales archaeon]|jgi:alpha-beta hydrolase superfamily lysophospholipase
MEHKESKYITRDGIDIFYQVWKPEGTPKGIVQLVHGLAEHAGRYMHVINKLVPEGYIIYGDDHRGHEGQVDIKDSLSQFKNLYWIKRSLQR